MMDDADVYISELIFLDQRVIQKTKQYGPIVQMVSGVPGNQYLPRIGREGTDFLVIQLGI